MENFINNAPFIVVLLCLIVGFVFLVKGEIGRAHV